MRTSGAERTISEIRQPLKQVLTYLSPKSSRIGAAWGRLLGIYEPCRLHRSNLMTIHPMARMRDLTAAPPRTCQDESERQGMRLASLGVPAECSVAAIGLYVDCCLPYFAESGKAQKWQRALVRWASVYQFLLLAGYSRLWAEERQTLEERADVTERRFHDFSVKLGDAYEKERRRLAQDLHDEIGHDLIVLKLYTQVISLDLKKGQIAQVRSKLRESVSLIKHALAGIRHLVFDLGPAIWCEQGFLPAVRIYTRQYAERTGIKVRFSVRRLRAELPGHYETALYKVLQGALANVAAHAEARRVEISLASSRDQFVFQIKDDGKGFNPSQKLKAQRSSYGLRAMRDRIELLGGSIEFRSRPSRRPPADSRGTTVEVRLPLLQPEGTR